MPKPFSETLESIGFSPAAEKGLSLTHSPNPAERGTFYQGGFAGIDNTVAVDETGEMWIMDGHVDLLQHGFKPLTGETIQ